MKKLLPACFRGLICSVALLCMHFSTFASHIVGCDLFYTWITGNQYKVTVILYGNCGPLSSSAFSTLPTSTPYVCIWDGSTYFSTIHCAIEAPSAGVEITPVCPDDSESSQCWIPSSTIPGIKKFVYSTTVTLPHTSRNWRFVYTGDNGPGSAAGRAASITNINAPGSSIMQLIDTLNNSVTGLYANNTSPALTVVPTPFFCLNNTDCYNPGALDPDGDSLRFALVPPTNGSSGGGTAASCAVGAALTYVTTPPSWSGQPLTGATPLEQVTAPPSFYFDPSTGQICFYPTVTQRSVVVYNIDEYRNDTFMGSCQREMTFVVLTCTNTAPTSASAGLSGMITQDDPTHYHICGNAGDWCVTFNSSEPSDPANLITLTVTGLTAGMTYTVTGNGTPTPSATICGNTSTMPPGLYTFFLHMEDNNCPLTGNNTQAYSINIYPVPSVRDSIVTSATCTTGAIVYIIPGGTGKPWTIDVSGGGLDTFQRFVDSVMFIDTLAPGTDVDTISIFTNVSHECGAFFPVVIPPPAPIVPLTVFANPSYCGATDGGITLTNLVPGAVDTVRYNFDGVPQTLFFGSVFPGGTLQFPSPPISLPAGTYDNMIVSYGYCKSNPLTVVLTNPPFPIRTLTSVNPNRCGYCNGAITLYGLNPNQLDTIYYTHNGTATGVSYYVGPDSMVLLTGLCDGDTYTSFFARTDSECLTATLPGVTLKGPALNDSFKVSIDYGCHGDTVIFTNDNYSDSDHILTYHWYFGDGYTDTAQNPNHIYFNGLADTAFVVKLYATNGTVCVDSFFHNLKLLNYIQPSYTFTPAPYVCQLTPVDFTNTSINLSPPDKAPTTYTWDFGNGNTSVGTTPTNVFTNTGVYTVTLIETNFVPCSDSFIQTVVVDTISNIGMLATDTTICRGKDITFTAQYAGEGSTGNVWSITDGFGMTSVNPLVHGFDQAGQYIVSVTAQYRACPETTATKIINVFSYPDVYLGPDTSICPGSNSIILADNQNTEALGAKWLWNTGDSSSSIVVVKPGYYYTVVTINGCSSTDTVWVQKDCYMDIPNVFTPNGDGVNDYFYPRQLLTRGMTTFNMNIYNRWGQLVYTTTSLDGRGWDGTFNNQPQAEGVFVYIIDATFKDGQNEHHQGNLTLLR